MSITSNATANTSTKCVVLRSIRKAPGCFTRESKTIQALNYRVSYREQQVDDINDNTDCTIEFC